MTNETPPIEVAANAVTIDMLAAGVRQIALCVGAIGTVLGLLRGRDLVGLIAWLQSSEAATAGAAAIGLGALLWGQWKARHRAKQVVSVAKDDRVPEAVATLKAAA